MNTAQQRIAIEVHSLFVSSEKLADQASVHIAVCQSKMQIAAGELQLENSVGLRALQKISEANALMVRVRQLMIEAHPHMKRIQADLGGEDGYGHMEQTPKVATKFEAPVAEPVVPLSIAA